MSDLRTQFLKAKLRDLPPEPPMPPHDLSTLSEADEEDGSAYNNELRPASSSSSASSASTIRPLSLQRPSQPQKKKPTLTPIPWQAHFTHSLDLADRETRITHHVYLTPPTSNGPLFILHHGAGSSALSFALLASALRRHLPTAGVLSIDCRGHGSTTTTTLSSGSAADLSLPTLTSDLLAAINLTASNQGWSALPDIVLVGHSLGGAVVVSLAHSGALGPALLGYAVLDVVEGSAMDALQSMHIYLSSRPSGFSSLEQGIEWHTRSRTLRNAESARISVPGLLEAAAAAAAEEEEEEGESAEAGGKGRWKWRTDLAATQPFWEGWFVGLSKKFLEAKGGKLLILAGADRLDKELMIGQMQGKYQLLVLPNCGHFVHEDEPEKTAEVLAEFYKRNGRSALVLPPKVGDMYRPGAGKHYASI